jgi:hypothetical protein
VSRTQEGDWIQQLDQLRNEYQLQIEQILYETKSRILDLEAQLALAAPP